MQPPVTPAQRASPVAGTRLDALDGLRGILALFFVAGHFGVTWLAGMWQAMTSFFVISGFLIGRLLAGELLRTGGLDVARFYVRRARRLLPGLLLLLAVLLLYAVLLAPPWLRRTIGADALATLGFVMNWRLVAIEDQYFMFDGVPSLLRHAWSLAVEEQFYVLAPFVLLLLFRWVRGRRARVTALLTGAVLATIWTAYVGLDSLEGYPRAYYGTDTRASALFVGLALGVGLSRRADGTRVNLPRPGLVGWVSFAVMLTMFLTIDPYAAWMWNRGGLLLAALASAGVVAACAHEAPSRLKAMFSSRPAVWVGVRAYGVYLWHWPLALGAPLLTFAWPSVPRWVFAVGGAAATIGLAGLSFRFVEAPVLLHGMRGFLPRVRRPALAALVPVALVAGTAGAAYAGTPAPATVVAADDPTRARTSRPLAAGQPAYVPSAPARVAVFGDSIPAGLAEQFPKALYPDVAVTNLARSGCDLLDLPIVLTPGVSVPVDAKCTFVKDRVGAATRTDRVEVFLLFASPMLAVEHEGRDGSTVTLADRSVQDEVVAQWERLRATALAAGAAQVQIVDLGCRDTMPQDWPTDLKVRFQSSPALRSEYFSGRTVNALVDRFVAANPDVPRIRLSALQCPGGRSLDTLAGLPVYEDGRHFDHRIVPSLWRWLLGQVSVGYAARSPR